MKEKLEAWLEKWIVLIDCILCVFLAFFLGYAFGLHSAPRDFDTLWVNDSTHNGMPYTAGYKPFSVYNNSTTLTQRERVYGRAMRRLKEKEEDYK
mgnify:CR=1